MLAGKHALVTGGGTGIGLAIARALRTAGAEVTIAGRRAEVLEAAGGGLHPQVMDVTDEASVRAGFAADYLGQPLTFNALCPAYVETEMVPRNIERVMAREGMSRDEATRVVQSANPHGRLIPPDDIAQAALWLCGPGSDSVNGQAIQIAGGEF